MSRMNQKSFACVKILRFCGWGGLCGLTKNALAFSWQETVRFLAVAGVTACVLLGQSATADTISSGTTNSSEISAWPVTVESGGTLQLDQKNVGAADQTLTISGTGNGMYNTTYNRGAIFSNVDTSTMKQANGIMANVVVDGSASSLVAGDSGKRLRYQGKVTGGTLTTYSLNGSETHAGYKSSFNLDKLIIGTGNFTFCGTGDDGKTKHAQKHTFKNGIEVQNGGILRMWADSEGLYIYKDEARTELGTITLNAGSSFVSQGGGFNTLHSNFYLAGNATFNLSTTDLAWRQGVLTSTAGTKLTITNNDGDNIARPFGLYDVTINADVEHKIVKTLFHGGSTMNGTLTLTSGSVTFEKDAAMTGALMKASASTLNLDSGATMTLTGNSTIAGTVNTLSGDINVAEGKVLTLDTVTTGNTDAATAGTITLAKDAQILVKENTTSVLNAEVILTDDASIKLNATGDADEKKALLTVNSISGAGKTLTFATGARPGGKMTAEKIEVGKLLMNNSSDLIVDELIGSIQFFRVNDFQIGKSLTLGTDGITKGHTDNTSCVIRFADGATLDLMDSVNGNVNILNAYGNYDIQLGGTLTVDTAKDQTLTWKNSKLTGKNATAAANKLVKIGAGTLNMQATTANISELALNVGVTNMIGAHTIGNTRLAQGATLSAGDATDVVGKLSILGDLDIAGNLVVDVKDGEMDLIDVTGDVDLLDGYTLTLNFLDETLVDVGTEFLIASGTLDGFDLEKVIMTGVMTDKYSVQATGNALSLMMATNPEMTGVPEPATWVLLVSGMLGIGYVARHKNRKT
ncbi:MAG: hypothetical protein Q4C70_08435 [Planctomycetia bacterium]|nr:hypothetical protein [Planctomycetia bacterium]